MGPSYECMRGAVNHAETQASPGGGSIPGARAVVRLYVTLRDDLRLHLGELRVVDHALVVQGGELRQLVGLVRTANRALHSSVEVVLLRLCVLDGVLGHL